MISENIIKKSFWALPIPEVLDCLETNQEGLTENEAKERLNIFGANAIPEKSRATKFKIFLEQLQSPLIFLLVIAGLVSVLVKDYNDALIILAAAFFNTFLGFYQENKAGNALAHLKSYIEERVRTIRENREYEIDSTELVPGDIIHLTQGDRIPADGRLLYINDLTVDESILTGESLPVRKSIQPVNFQAVIGDQKNMVFSGTLIVQGFANAVVCNTGLNSELGRIASLVRNHHRQEDTPLQTAINRFSVKASIILISLTAVVFAIGLFSGRSPFEMFLTSVAIAVSAVPEGLPVALTVILAVGVQRLARKKAVVKKLLAAETLGSTSIILTDKTGTLTEAKMSLANITTMDNSESTQKFLLQIAIINSDVVIENPKDPYEKWRIVGRPLETAVVRAGAAFGVLAHKIKKEVKTLGYLPFNSLNKYSAAIIESEGKEWLTVFGAPEILLKLSGQTSEEEGKKITQNINHMAHSGERVLGVATKDVTGKNFSLTANAKIENLKFLGTISFRDPLRPGVHDAIHRTQQVGIKTVIVTGDHRGTAETIAKELGFPIKKENGLDGAELENLSMEELKLRLPNLSFVSRVSPEGKVKIVKGYQEMGAIVAMTGDGVNDAPSLKQADIGIAMGSGADVAKDVSELVLLNDNYETIVTAIAEGRRIMENIRKVIVYFFSSVGDELILIGGSLLFGLTLPLSAVQILWVNLITDSLPAITLAFEDRFEYLFTQPRKLTKGLLDREMKFLIFAISLPTSFLLFGLYYGLLKAGFDPLLVRTFIFASFGTYSLFLIFAIRNLQRSIFTFNPFSNLYVVAGVVLGLTLMAFSIYWLPLQNILNTIALPPVWLWGVFAVGFVNILAIEVGKLVIKKL